MGLHPDRSHQPARRHHGWKGVLRGGWEGGTAMPITGKRIFISVANREHAELRATLRDVLARAGFDVVVQPDFPHTATDTVGKLDDLIAPCDLLLHIAGRDPGSRAAPPSVEDFFRRTERAAFLAHLPEARSKLGDYSTWTY